MAKPTQYVPMPGPKAAPAKKPIAPPPPLAPNVGYGLVNPGTTLPPVKGGFDDWISNEERITNEQNARNAGAAPPAPPAGGDGSDIDWAQVYFGNYGLPSDLISQIEGLGKKYGTTNPDVFFQSAQNLVRGSDWFKTTFPGFAAGVTAGLYADETGYRGYVNNLNSVYKQYLGRSVSGDETAAALAQGATPDLIGRQFQGDAVVAANQNDWQYLTGAFDTGQLSGAEKTALGREQAGIDTPLGQMVQKRVQQASARAAALFSGTLASSSKSLASGRLSSPGLAAGPQNDYAA